MPCYGGPHLKPPLANKADGFFGENTAATVRAFQTAQGIEADGVVGDDTYERLGIE